MQADARVEADAHQIARDEANRVAHAVAASACARASPRELSSVQHLLQRKRNKGRSAWDLVDPLTGWETVVPSEQLCAAGLRSSDNTICCPASCGVCGGHDAPSNLGCSKRPGGPSQCCGKRILRSLRRCFYSTSVGCHMIHNLSARAPWLISWAPRPAPPLPSAAAAMPIALGLYAPTCAHVAAFTLGCIGCALSPHTLHITAMLDRASEDRRGGAPCCRAADVTALTASLLSPQTLAVQQAGGRVNFQKTRALFGLMRRHSPGARCVVYQGRR